MAKRLKRAFTIVELVIVIAVIAILAAVLIPTFTTLIDKANESNDIALVKNLNTALVSKEATDEVNTMQDALDAAYEYGYTVDKLTPSSSGDIVWDEVNNRFALINDGEVVFGEGTVSSGASLWRIAKDTKDFSATYSNYLAGKWTTVPVASTGVDVGTNEGLDVTYTNTDTDAGQTVTIRTTGGTLTVDGPYDTVNHYDMAVKVVVKAVAKNSYHEYGEVLGNIELASGRVVVENNATVSTILVTAQSADSIKVEVNSNATVGTVAATNKNVITDANTTVPSTTDKVTEAITTSDDFAGGVGTEKSPFLIADKASLKTIREKFSSQMGAGTPYYFKLISDITIEENDDTVVKLTNGDYTVIPYLNGVFDGNGHSLTWGYYTPASATTWFTFIYYIQPAEAEKTVTVKNLNIYLKSFATPVYVSLVGTTGDGFGGSVLQGQVIYENIDFFNADQGSVSFPGNNHGILSGFVAANVTVRDCNTYLNASSAGVNGVWFGAMQFDGYKVKFERVNNYGVYSGTSLGYFFGNDSYIQKGDAAHEGSVSFTLEQIKACVEVVDCYNEGVIYKTAGQNKFFMLGSSGTISGTAWEEFSDELLKDFNRNGGVAMYLQSSGKISYEVVDGKISVSNASSEVSKLTLSYTTMYRDSEGRHGGFSLTIDITNALDSQYKAKFATTVDGALDGYMLIATVSEEESANGVEYFICKKGDDYYYVFNNLADHLPTSIGDDVTLQGVTITINGYNSSNTLVDYTKVA